jgi:hypothetical protein
VNYGEWIEKVPQSIKSDPLWEIEVYRKALFLSDLAWRDCDGMLKHDGRLNNFGIQGVALYGAPRLRKNMPLYAPSVPKRSMIWPPDHWLNN